MAHWTTRELRLLDAAHRKRRPSGQELAALLPRHSMKSILLTCWSRGLRQGRPKRDWLVIAHLYFAGREAEQRRAGG